MFTVMGATGQVGGAIVRELLAGGGAVRALGRSESRLAELGALGAQPVAGDAADVDYLTDAFHGADGVFVMLPFDPSVPDFHAHQDRIGESIVAAIRASGVGHVMALSSVGADLDSGVGVIGSLHAQEERLRQLRETHILVLRPGSFFENFHTALDLIEGEGFYADAVRSDAPVPMIAVRDIAAVAARALRARDWEGYLVRELLGPCDLTYAEATRILGASLGKPDLPYVTLPPAEAEKALVAGGFSEDCARHYVEFSLALGAGTIRSREGRNAKNTTPTTFEEFATELAAAVRGR